MLGDTLKELRLINKYTQEEIAKKLKISKSTIGMYEQNRRSPDLETLIQFANFFRVSTDYLLGVELKREGNLIDFKMTWSDIVKAYPNAIQLSPEKRDIIKYYEQLSITDKRWIMGQMIDLIKKSDDYSDTFPKVAE